MLITLSLIVLGALTSVVPSVEGTILSNSGCLCTSDQPCWPSSAVFSQLASQVSQPLVYPHPTAWPCYPPSDPAGNCIAVTENWTNATWRADQPGSLEWANWESFVYQNDTLDACYLNTTVLGVCGQGRVPVVGVDARSVADVQAAIAFAVEYGLKLAVKNTGHDYVGRSSAKGSFVVWTHNMKNTTYDAAFIPQGGPANETFEALTVGAGVQFNEAYAAVHHQNRLMVGGNSVGSSIGAAGGWLMGGGQSWTSPTYGLGVDNVLEISIVLSTGEYLVTNAYQHPDLFWALRGGGGSTYGIVTSATYRTYPEAPVQFFEFQANVTNSSALQELVEYLLQYQPELSAAGWGGYGLVSSEGISFEYYGPNMTNETAATSIQPWLDFAQSLTPYGVLSLSQTSTYSSWFDTVYELSYSSGASGLEIGQYLILSSRLVSGQSVTANASQVARILINDSVPIAAVAGGKVSEVDPDMTGLNPAWRKAIFEVVFLVSWTEETPLSETQTMLGQFRQQIQEMHDATPNDGAYFNEASQFEIDWQYTFFGDHYDTLKRVKDTYDPYRLFVVTEGVGSEDWNKNLTCRF